MEAPIELDLLRQALGDLQGIKLDGQSRREIDLLRGQERNLTTLLDAAMTAAGRRSTPSDAPPGTP